MEILFKIVLIIHVIAGSMGFFTGTLNIARKKGDVLHKRVGTWFLYSMLINGFAGLVMAVMHTNYFLLIIAVFSIYLVGTGQRSLSLKQLSKGQKPKNIDWILSLSMLVFAIGFVGFGGYLIFNQNNFGIVMVVFGIISILMVLKDIKNYKGNSKFKNDWLLTHIQRMIGGYIAATTAFLVVNNTILPSVVAWLLPTVILTPLIFYWSKKNAVISK
jgi:hypothetical protein